MGGECLEGFTRNRLAQAHACQHSPQERDKECAAKAGLRARVDATEHRDGQSHVLGPGEIEDRLADSVVPNVVGRVDLVGVVLRVDDPGQRGELGHLLGANRIGPEKSQTLVTDAVFLFHGNGPGFDHTHGVPMQEECRMPFDNRRPHDRLPVHAVVVEPVAHCPARPAQTEA